MQKEDYRINLLPVTWEVRLDLWMVKRLKSEWAYNKLYSIMHERGVNAYSKKLLIANLDHPDVNVQFTLWNILDRYFKYQHQPINDALRAKLALLHRDWETVITLGAVSAKLLTEKLASVVKQKNHYYEYGSSDTASDIQKLTDVLITILEKFISDIQSETLLYHYLF